MKHDSGNAISSTEDRLKALSQVIVRIAWRTGIGFSYATILGLIAIFSGKVLPPDLAIVPQTMLLNSINSILDRIAARKPVTDDEILQAFKNAFEDSRLGELYSADMQTQRLIGGLFRRSDVMWYELKNHKAILHEILNYCMSIEGINIEFFELFAETRVIRANTERISEQVERLISLIESSDKQVQNETSQGTPSAVLVNTQDNVPRRARKVFGRDNEIRNLLEQINQNKPILLYGFIGQGKTALAAEVVAEWIKSKFGYALWIEAGSQEVSSVFEAIARAFGREQRIAQLLGIERQQEVRNLLAENNIRLLVVDNARNGPTLLEIEGVVPGKSSLLVTSRLKYPLEVMHEVQKLAIDSALEILSYYAGRDYKESQDAKDLCEAISFLPFLLVQAGINLKVRGYGPKNLLNQIESAPHTLKAPANYAEPGYDSISTLLNTTLADLDIETRDVLLAFGAFFAPVATPELLSIFLDQKTGAKHVENALHILSDNTLCTAFRAPVQSIEFYNYQLHDLAYSYSKTVAKPEDRVQALNACIIFAQRHSQLSRDDPGLINHFVALVTEFPNFLGAATWAMETERYAEVDTLVKALYGTEPHILSNRGFYAQRIKLLEYAVSATGHLGAKSRQASYLNNLGHALNQTSQYRPAIDRFRQALTLVEGQRKIEGEIRGNLAIAFRQLGQYTRAIVQLRKSLTIAQEIGDGLGEAQEFNNLGNLCGDFGSYEHAIKHYESALQVNRHLSDPDPIFEGIVLGNMGVAYREIGDLVQARGFHLQALEISRKEKDPDGEATESGNLGKVMFAMGFYEEALAFHEQALAIARDKGLRQIEGEQIGDLVKSKIGLELRALQQALELVQTIDDLRTQGDLLIEMGKVYHYLGRFDEALDCYERANVIFSRLRLGQVLQQIELYSAMAELGTKKAQSTSAGRLPHE